MPLPADDGRLSRRPDGDARPPCAYCQGQNAGSVPDVPAAAELEADWLAHLYLCCELSTYAIAGRTGADRQRVTRALHKAGVPVRPRGTGRQRPDWRPSDLPSLPALMHALYTDAGLSSREVAALLGMPERTVRERLHRYGIRARTRGGDSREDRTTVPANLLRILYVDRGLSAAEVGARLGVSVNTVLRSAHALGVPVRAGGMVPMPGPDEIVLVTALYADPLIAAVLTAHDIPQVPPGGAVSERFPEPFPLSTPLVKDLYWGCGAGLNHIELLTGQAADSVRGFMRRASIQRRRSGGRTPFVRRWRSGLPGSMRSDPFPRPSQVSSGETGRARSAAIRSELV
jgi:hypothetical protein